MVLLLRNDLSLTFTIILSIGFTSHLLEVEETAGALGTDAWVLLLPSLPISKEHIIGLEVKEEDLIEEEDHMLDDDSLVELQWLLKVIESLTVFNDETFVSDSMTSLK